MRTIKKEQIIQEATRLFAQYGYKKTTLDDIAQAMGMTRGNLYHYVENKEDLYFQCIEVILNRWKEEISEVTNQQTNSMERVKAMLFSSIEYPKTHPYFCALILEDPTTISNSYFEKSKLTFDEIGEEVLKEFLHDGIYRGILREVNIESVVRYILTTHKLYLFKIYHQDYDETAMQEYLDAIDLIYQGLKKQD